MKKLITFLIVFVIVFITACNTENMDNMSGSQHAIISGPIISKNTRQLPNKQVCMVNNKFMGKDQIPVLLKDKTYYGCCEACVVALKKDELYHFAKDPITGLQVDKATAIIIIDPGSRDDVLYFNTTESAKQYIDEK